MKYFFDKIYAIDPDKTLPTDYIGGKGKAATGLELSDVMSFINEITAIALDIAIIVGVLMIFYSSFLYVTSFGEESKAETAKKTLLWSAIGTIVVFLAKIIINNLKEIIKSPPV